MIERSKTLALRSALRAIDELTALLTSTRARIAHADLGLVEAAARPADDMVAKIRLLIWLRYGVDVLVPVTLYLLAIEGLQLVAPTRQHDNLGAYLVSLWPNWTLAGIGLVINGAYQLMLQRRASLRPIAYAQVWMDIFLFAIMVYTTGGISSPFAFLFTVPILAASLLLSFRAALQAAATSTVLLAAVGWLQYHAWIPSERYFEAYRDLLRSPTYLIAMITLNGVMYFLIAFVSGALSRTVHEHERTLQRRANEATMLYEVSNSLQSTTRLDDVLVQIMDTVIHRLGIDHALMYLMNDTVDGLDLKVERFNARITDPPYGNMRVHFELKREAGLTAICALEKETFNVTDPLNHPLINRDLAIKLGINPFAVAPMMARGQVIGVIGVDRRFQNGIITHAEAQILSVVANQAGLTIQNAKLYERGRT
ncbi:MAG: GAF domain-containing protein [Candidatus Coatesbacteria bacterium]